MSKIKEFYISPDLGNDDLTKSIDCFNEAGEQIKLPVVTEVPLTIYLNKQEIVTAMTLGDMPELLAVGYLLNQKMLKNEDIISEINYDKELQVVVVRTNRKTNYEKKMEKKIRTSGCAVGTVYGDIMDDFSSINLDKNSKIKTSWIYTISKKINTRPSLYLKAGALHGCVLCKKDSPLIYVEDVARCNVDALKSDVNLGFYNVGTEVQTSIKELCDTILRLKSSDLEVVYKPYTEDDARSLVQNRIGSKVEILRLSKFPAK